MAVRIISSIVQSGVTERGAAINVQIALNDGTSMILQFGADLATQFVETLNEGIELAERERKICALPHR